MTTPTIPDPTPGRRAVLVLEYEVADDAPMGALAEAWGATLKAAPDVEGVRHVNTHAATREAAEMVLAVIAEEWS